MDRPQRPHWLKKAGIDRARLTTLMVPGLCFGIILALLIEPVTLSLGAAIGVMIAVLGKWVLDYLCRSGTSQQDSQEN